MKYTLDPDRQKPRPPYDWEGSDDIDQWNAPMTNAETAFVRGAITGAVSGAVLTLVLIAFFWWVWGS